MPSALHRRSLERRSTGPGCVSVARRSRLDSQYLTPVVLEEHRPLFPLPNMRFNFLAMCEVVGNTRVNVVEADEGKLWTILLGCRSEFEMMNNRIQTHSRAFDANGPMLGDSQGTLMVCSKTTIMVSNYT
jgi:hypothetical protein